MSLSSASNIAKSGLNTVSAESTVLSRNVTGASDTATYSRKIANVISSARWFACCLRHPGVKFGGLWKFAGSDFRECHPECDFGRSRYAQSNSWGRFEQQLQHNVEFDFPSRLVEQLHQCLTVL